MSNYANDIIAALDRRGIRSGGYGDSAGNYILAARGEDPANTDRVVTVSNEEQPGIAFPAFPTLDQRVIVVCDHTGEFTGFDAGTDAATIAEGVSLLLDRLELFQ